jgi:hypothetical protein
MIDFKSVSSVKPPPLRRPRRCRRFGAVFAPFIFVLIVVYVVLVRDMTGTPSPVVFHTAVRGSAREPYRCSLSDNANTLAAWEAFFNTYTLNRTDMKLDNLFPCSGSNVIDAIWRADPYRIGKSFVDIGANKGWALASIQLRWAPELGALGGRQEEHWRSTFEGATRSKLDPGEPCGACGDCTDSVDSVYGGAELVRRYKAGSFGPLGSLQLVGVEAAPATFEALAASPLAEALRSAGLLRLVHAAVTDGKGATTVRFLNCDAGLEFCNGHENGASCLTWTATAQATAATSAPPFPKQRHSNLAT